MFSKTTSIKKEDSVTDIVSNDYRTADVFLKYGIEFCCGGKWPLENICASKNIDVAEVINDLDKASKNIHLSNEIRFHDWNPAFLADFIVNVHHQYIRNAMPIVVEYVQLFLDGHQKKYPELKKLQELINELNHDILSHIQQEEDIYFPYIKRITHAWLHKEPYADLLVRTLRKPLQDMAQQDHEFQGNLLQQIRELTAGYTPPEKACVTHRVTFFKLKQLDDDMVQHLYLENDILFPKALQIEKELLAEVI